MMRCAASMGGQAPTATMTRSHDDIPRGHASGRGHEASTAQPGATYGARLRQARRLEFVKALTTLMSAASRRLSSVITRSHLG